MANKRLITRLVFKPEAAADPPDVILGEEFGPGGMVKSISFRNITHQTTGSSGCPCYVVTFVNSTLQMVIPRGSVKYSLTDKTQPQAEEDGVQVPELPDDEEG